MKNAIQHEKQASTHHIEADTSPKASNNKPATALTKSQESVDWLALVGGVAMESCSTRQQLLSLALRAPDDYTFGIAFGKIVDILALKKVKACAAYPIVFERGPVSDIERGLQNDVFDRAIGIERRAEETDAQSYESMTYLYSKEKTDVLQQQLKSVRHPFLKGQLTSWLRTNEILARTHSVFLVN